MASIPTGDADRPKIAVRMKSVTVSDEDEITPPEKM